TNGSVHSRFKPIGDGVVALSNHGGGTSLSSFMQQGDSRGRNSENMRVFEGLDGGNKMRNVSRPERIVREIVSESIPIVSLTIQELTDEVVASTKEYLKNLIENKKEELVSLQ
ncbi:protein OBERON 3-like, partial [Trifolium medium]|nr:protein OBERON 3-like [Trifolium medium]